MYHLALLGANMDVTLDSIVCSISSTYAINHILSNGIAQAKIGYLGGSP